MYPGLLDHDDLGLTPLVDRRWSCILGFGGLAATLSSAKGAWIAKAGLGSIRRYPEISMLQKWNCHFCSGWTSLSVYGASRGGAH